MFVYLSEYLGTLQRSLPYLVTWTIYPVSFFDVGIVHHAVDHFCPSESNWAVVGCGVAFRAARQLRAPLFVTNLAPLVVPPELDLANELLAEAQLAIFRRLPRLAVLNSFTAIETLANAVYRLKRNQQLSGWGVPESDAESIAEHERKAHRTDEKFLLNSGMQGVAARSLFTEDQKTYESIIRLEEKCRHSVVHRGTKPSIDEAKEAFKVCCVGARWLSDVAGFPIKDLLPKPSEAIHGIQTGGMEPHVSSPAEIEVLARMLNICRPTSPVDQRPA